MPAEAAERLPSTRPDRGDPLDHLTIAYAEMRERHGPLSGVEGVSAPADKIPFAAGQAQLATMMEETTRADERAALMLSLEANRHEQTGRLATYVAGYEATHGNPAVAEDMRQLGRDHLDLAAGLRETFEVTMPKPSEELTHEAIDRDPMHAVNLPIPATAAPSLLQRIETTAGEIAAAQYADMVALKSGAVPAPAWAEATDAPDAHEEAEASWLRAESRQEEARSRLQAMTSDELSDLMPADAKAEVTKRNAADRGNPGRGL